MKTRGFTLIELLIVVAFVIIATRVAWVLFNVDRDTMKIHSTGVSEVICQGGYKFVSTTNHGSYGTGIVQIIDKDGKAVPCGG